MRSLHRPRRAASWLTLLLFAGCAIPPPEGPARNPCGTAPAEVLACARAREDAVRSMRARFTATTQRGGESNVSAGVLLVSKPERFRLRLMLPLGLTVFDYVREGDRVHISLPLEGDAAAGNRLFDDLDLAEAFLRGPYAFPGTCAAAAAGDGAVVAECRAADGTLLRDFRLDAASGAIVEETSWSAGQQRLQLRYADYRPSGGALLPWHITLAYPQREVTLDIEIERYEVNPMLPPALFQPPAP